MKNDLFKISAPLTERVGHNFPCLRKPPYSLAEPAKVETSTEQSGSQW